MQIRFANLLAPVNEHSSFRRWIIWQVTVFVLAVSLGACSGTSISPTGPASSTPTTSVMEPATLELVPAEITLPESGSLQIQAVLKDSLGRLVPTPSLVWSSSDPTVVEITPTGMVTARSRGVARITVETRRERRRERRLRREARVTVGDSVGSGNGSDGSGAAAPADSTSPGSSPSPADSTGQSTAPPPADSTGNGAASSPGRVSDLRVNSVTTGSVTLQFTQVDDGAGAPASYEVRFAPSPLTWVTAAGVGSGTCAAPLPGSSVGDSLSCTVENLDSSTAYDFQLQAFRTEADGSIVDGDLSNVVSASTDAESTPPPDPPVPGSNQEHPNEPAGFTLISERPFNALAEDGWEDSSGSHGHMSIVTDPTAPVSPSSVGQALFPAGAAGGTSSGNNTGTRVVSLGYTQLYLSFWFKYSDNWQGHQSGVNKIFFITRNGDASNPVFLTAFGSGTANLKPQVRLQGTPTGARNLKQNLGSSGTLSRGEWHRWDLVLIMNTGSSPNGQVHWWIDGQKIGEYTDVLFSGTGESHVWDIVKWNPTWGGRGDTIMAEQTLRMDHAYLSGTK